MMAPEFYNINLAQNGYFYGVDNYALGILIYELLVGIVQIKIIFIYDLSPHLVIDAAK